MDVAEAYRSPTPASVWPLATSLLASLLAPWVAAEDVMSVPSRGRMVKVEREGGRRHTLDLVRNVVSGVLDGIHCEGCCCVVLRVE